MRVTPAWGAPFVVLLALACSLPAAVAVEPSPAEDRESPASAPTASPARRPAGDEEWALWSGGTRLRGANTWQRLVVPRYDGQDFLGDGYIGPPYEQADFDRLAALGANYVNLSHPGVYSERPPYALDERALANLDAMIAMATRADLFVVITFRTGPGRNDFTFYRDDDWFDRSDLVETVWSDPAAREAWAAMWRFTAERYRDHPAVVGYDLMCEPNAAEIVDEWDPAEFARAYGGTGYDWNAWYPDLVAAIRAVDPGTPVLVGGDGYSALDWLPYLRTVDDPRVVYTFHQYAPSLYTHQEPGEGLGYPGEVDHDYDGRPERVDRAWLQAYLATAGEFAGEHGAALAVNEYGAVRWAPGAADFVQDEMELFEGLGLNYAVWVWDPRWAPWNEGVNAHNFRFGPDPELASEVENELQGGLVEFWARNEVRPSDLH